VERKRAEVGRQAEEEEIRAEVDRRVQEKLREQSEDVPSEQPKTAASAVPWRVIAGSAIICVVAIVAVWWNWQEQDRKAREPYDMYYKGMEYQYGWGSVQQDYAKAREWYEKAADKGEVRAMIRLGCFYGVGLGGARDYSKAREWYQKAADHEDTDAKKRLQETEQQMAGDYC
jgi:hypothetical protein